MRDSLLIVPSTPTGVDPATHLRELLVAARDDAAQTTKRLHLDSHDCLRDPAAIASTALRELRQEALEAIEQELDDEGHLLELLGAFSLAEEAADHVLMSSDLRAGFEHDLATWEAVEPHALAIAELSGGMFVSYTLGQLRDPERLHRVERRARVPLMHALMRAVVAGYQRGPREASGFVDPRDRFDELLLKMISAHGPVPDDELRHLRFATTSCGALWNLARIAQRDDMSPKQAAAYIAARRDALDGIRRDTRFQQRELGVMPDYEYAYDVGVAYGMVEPILAARAERHGLRKPLRASAPAWADLFRSAPGDECLD